MNSQTHVVLSGTRRTAGPAKAIRDTDPNAIVELTVKVRRKAKLPDVRPGLVIPLQELNDQYGASQEDLNLTRQTLTEYGLSVKKIDPSTRSVHAAGPASAVERAFELNLKEYEYERAGRTPKRIHFRGREGDINIPVKLKDVVEGVFGLDQRPAVRKRSVSGSAITVGQYAKFSSTLAQMYGFPSGDGTGQTVAVLEFGGGYFANDFRQYCTASDINMPTVNPISVDGTPTNSNDEATGEVMLDVEVVAGVCPKATINVYFAGQSEGAWVQALDRAIQDNPSVISLSWGLAEDDQAWTASGRAQIDNALQQAALAGITVCISSGDDGSYDQLDDGNAHVDFPSCSPNALSVGGTQFDAKAANEISNEVVWFEGNGRRVDNGGATGGGVSIYFKRPTWQTVHVDSVNRNPIDGRIIPDIAALAGSPYYTVVMGGQQTFNGGTSASAPLIAGLICRIKQNLPSGMTMPFLAPLLYQIGTGVQTVGTNGCNDIVNGNNVTATVGGYRAMQGFDACTGWGTPNGNALLQALTQVIAELPH